MFQWTRYWCPPTGRIQMESDGYVLSPESPFGKYIQEDLTTLASLQAEPCLILLGEPGSGKTSEIDNEVARLNQSGQAAIKIDLRSIQNISEIESNEILLKWSQGDGGMVIFLDSFDEAPIPPTVLCDKLKELVQRLPKERLKLRIACRTAELPAENLLTNSLSPSFSAKQFEITPLDRGAVKFAVESSGLSAEETFQKFDTSGLGSLASKPLTLEMLLELLLAGKSLPKERREVFKTSLLDLCEEHNKGRISNNKIGALSADQRLIVASRVALYSLLQKKDAVRILPGNFCQDNDLHISSIIWGKEKVNGQEFTVDRTAVLETIKTGLFSARGNDRMGWLHQTYPDFLAALYIQHRNLSIEQVQNLLQDPKSKRIKPHLAECAAWLASFNHSFLQVLIREDPSILLRSDSNAFSDKDKKEITKGVLQAVDQKKLLDTSPGFRSYYKKLKYPRMAKDLKPYFTDPNHNAIVRRVAIDIAEACDVKELAKEMLKIALSQTENIFIRQQVAHAVSEIGDDKTKSQLSKILQGPNCTDDDELKGIVCNALYPKHLSLKEVLKHVSERKKSGVIIFGAFEAFMGGICEKMTDEELCEALEWTETQRIGGAIELHPNRHFVEYILQAGWSRTQSSKVEDALAHAIKARFKIEEYIYELKALGLPDNLPRDKRLNYVKLLINKHSLEQKDIEYLALGHPPLLDLKDLDEILIELKTADDSVKPDWCRLVSNMVLQYDRESLEKVMPVCKEVPELAAIFVSRIGPIELKSPEAERQKKEYQDMQRLRRTLEQDKKEHPKPPTVEEILDLPSPPGHSKWPQLALLINGKDLDSFPDPDIENREAWDKLNPEAVGRIDDEALNYLKKFPPNKKLWMDPLRIPLSSIFGHLAIRRLFLKSPQHLEKLNTKEFGAWASSVIVCPLNPDETDTKITKLIYDIHPEAVLEVIQFFAKNRAGLDSHIKECWDSKIEQIYIETIKNPLTKQTEFEDLLRAMLEHDKPSALNIAFSELDNPISRERAVSTGALAFSYAPSEAWPRISKIITSDPELGEAIFGKVAGDSFQNTENILSRLFVKGRGELYIWLRHRYPIGTDPETPDHYTGPRDLRETLIRSIRDSGDPESVEVIKSIERAFPEDEWMAWNQVGALDAIIGKIDDYPADEELKAILESKEVRMVRTGEDLLNVVIESLRRLEKDLQGETPLAHLFWNSCKGGLRPKDESALSDYVKKHLEKDLKNTVVAKREIEVRKVKHKSPRGDSTDIQVIIPASEEVEQITIIIEVKGDWNPEVMTAMKTQLRDRYLLQNKHHFGIYLVGWYKSPKRITKIKAADINEARKIFDKQAERLTTPEANIRAFVINVGLDDPKPKKCKKPKRVPKKTRSRHE